MKALFLNPSQKQKEHQHNDIDDPNTADYNNLGFGLPIICIHSHNKEWDIHQNKDSDRIPPFIYPDESRCCN
jgi:hypothetical protein